MTTTEFLSLIGAPWAAYHDHPDEDTARDAAYIRSRRRAKHGYTNITCVFGCDYPGKDGEAQRARRDLIAAAPELYEALEAALMVLDGNGPREVFDRARAALAKARGETGEQS